MFFVCRITVKQALPEKDFSHYDKIEYNNSMIRLFIAIPLPDETVKSITETYGGISGARWTEEEQLHLTLHFLGECTEEEMKRILTILDTIRFNHFSVEIEDSGSFPLKGDPKVLWLGVKKNKHLEKLHKTIKNRLLEEGFILEARSFKPHITAARLRKGTYAEDVVPWLKENAQLSLKPFRANEFCLYSSKLSPTGSTHYIEGVFELK